MQSTPASPTAPALEAAACHASLERVIHGPWTRGVARPVHPALHAQLFCEPAAGRIEWYARPLPVALGVTALCSAFWGAVALGVMAIL